MNIDEIMQLFQREPFWGLDKVKRPEPALLERFVSQYDLPEDYIRLLSISDGFVLFHAGDYRISDISWTVECYTNPVYGGGTFVGRYVHGEQPSPGPKPVTHCKLPFYW